MRFTSAAFVAFVVVAADDSAFAADEDTDGAADDQWRHHLNTTAELGASTKGTWSSIMKR